MSNDKFQNKYRSTSIRLQNWDYGWRGKYFVTICTSGREHSFGEIIDGKMQLSPVGVIADVLWHELKNHFDGIELVAFVVMPNHIHGIVAITEYIGKTENENTYAITVDTTYSDNGNDNNGNNGNNDNGNGNGNVDTTHALYLQPAPQPAPAQSQQNQSSPKTIGQKRFQNQGSHTLSSIVGSYKSAVSKHAHRMGFDFAWQSGYYENIVRNDIAFNRIQTYIDNNPKNWKEDKFYTK